MELPILYHKSKNGTIHQWRVFVDGADVCTEYGQVGGQLQTSRKRAEAKNVGKKNATTPEQQAMLEAGSLWRYNRERKYSETPEAAQETLWLPMLALDIAKKPKSPRFPADLQPKLDGVRCLSRKEAGKVYLTSRGGKPFNLPHIAAALGEILRDGQALDGEVYAHNYGFQTISSLIKDLQPETGELEYHVYDAPIDGTWVERRDYIAGDVFRGAERIGAIVRVPTITINSLEEAWAAQKQFVEQGYEGAMFRNHAGLYLMGYRSADLLKLKDFVDEDFEIVGYTHGKGRELECVMWICRNNDGTGRTFPVRPKGSLAGRKKLLLEAEKYIGSILKVEFQGRTDENMLRFPKGRGIRPPGDTGGERN